MYIDSLALDSLRDEVHERDLVVGPAMEYPHLNYSMKAVRKAGTHLAGSIRFDPGSYREALEIFSVANSWRDSHILPMRSVRLSVRARMRKFGLSGDMASRPKRMSSIRRKLRDSTCKLDQVNDLGGCRAIMDDIAGVNSLIDSIHERFPHAVRQEWPYIQQPKSDGYRSHHIVFQFQPQSADQEAFAGRRIELQVRTRLQHAWATAVEAVSLYRGQDLKHGKGDGDWLRLFELVSAEFAYVEGCFCSGANIADRKERVRELQDINRRIGAVNVLDNIKNATHFAERFLHERGRYYLLRYGKDHSVKVETYDTIMAATGELGRSEVVLESGESDERVVLVEVDKVDKLIQTYPNYFGDVSLFVANLRKICDGQNAVEYTMAPQEVVRPKKVEAANPDQWRRRYTKWIEPGNRHHP